MTTYSITTTAGTSWIDDDGDEITLRRVTDEDTNAERGATLRLVLTDDETYDYTTADDLPADVPAKAVAWARGL